MKDQLKSAKKQFLELLVRYGKNKSDFDDYISITQNLQSSLINYLSDNDSNRETSEYLKYGFAVRKYGPDCQGVVFDISGNNVPLSELIYSAGGSDIPESTKEQYPGLKQEEWEQAIRLAWAILKSLEWNEHDDPERIKEWIDSITP